MGSACQLQHQSVTEMSPSEPDKNNTRRLRGQPNNSTRLSTGRQGSAAPLPLAWPSQRRGLYSQRPCLHQDSHSSSPSNSFSCREHTCASAGEDSLQYTRSYICANASEPLTCRSFTLRCRRSMKAVWEYFSLSLRSVFVTSATILRLSLQDASSNTACLPCLFSNIWSFAFF